jgi:hypothetical protein
VFWIEDDLDFPVPVTQINEDNSAEISPDIDPSVECNLLPDILNT